MENTNSNMHKNDNSYVLSALSYLSIFFAPVILPLFVWILADEPTSALDNYKSSLFFELIKANFKGKGILLITHEADILKKYSDYIYVIENGCLIEKGSSEDIFESPKEEWTRKFVICSQKILDSGGEWEWTK